VEVVFVAGARGHFLFLSFIVRLVIQSQYVVLPELRPTSPALVHLVTNAVRFLREQRYLLLSFGLQQFCYLWLIQFL
jgi:hypothetical protein